MQDFDITPDAKRQKTVEAKIAATFAGPLPDALKCLNTQAPPQFVADVRGLLTDLAVDAYCYQGQRAFELPRKAAAIHEGGHAVIAQLTGRKVRSARVRPSFHPDGNAAWGGTTDTDHALSFSPETSFDEDRTEALNTLAGLCAEILFHKDFRLGSSFDELTMTKVLAGAIATKNGVDERAVMVIFNETATILKAHAGAVKGIASWLMRHRKMNEERLRAVFRLHGVCPR